MLDEKEQLPEEKEISTENLKTTEISDPETTESKEENSEADKAIGEIDKRIAEISEKDDSESDEMPDYESFSLEELLASLNLLMEQKEPHKIGKNVNKIKSVFNNKFGAILKEEKQKFLDAGGESIDFKYSNPTKTAFNEKLTAYKMKRSEFFKNQEEVLSENLEVKTQLIENLKHLIDNAEGATMYKKFKEIQDSWNKTGPIPRTKYSDVWRTYHHHVERFYDLLHLNNDLRELDFKHNLEEKLKLVDRAEALAKLDDPNKAFKELQEIHKMWKEDVGPVAREHREAIWNRFSAATKTIHDKRHEHYKGLKSQFEANVSKKMAVISEIENMDFSGYNSRSDWQKGINEMEVLRTKFFAVGQVPRAKSDAIWAKFKEATRRFNSGKNKFFKNVKKEHLTNLNKKKELIARANELKESEDWDSATEIMKRIQSDWKKIGHVPRKYSDNLWKEFKDACNHYFDRLHAKQDAGNQEMIEVFNQKKSYLGSLKEQVDEGAKVGLKEIASMMEEWKALGPVPRNMRHIEGKFSKFIDSISIANNIEKEEVEMMKFKNTVDEMQAQRNFRKLDSEQLFIRKKIDETVREIQQLENNVGFISNVSDDNPLLNNVKNQIKEYEERLKVWKAKLNYLQKLEY